MDEHNNIVSEETWNPSPIWGEIYEVSTAGRIRRSLNAPRCNSTKPGRILCQNPDSVAGYFRTTLRNKGKIERVQVHRLVARAFLTGFEPSRHVNHKNGDKADNRVENLEWVTPRENVIHAWETGLCKPITGESNWNSKLDDEKAKVALFLMSRGVQGRLLAEAFGVTETAISCLRRGETWRHVTQQAEEVGQ